jgi:hypothetical protein
MSYICIPSEGNVLSDGRIIHHLGKGTIYAELRMFSEASPTKWICLFCFRFIVFDSNASRAIVDVSDDYNVWRYGLADVSAAG